MPEVDWAEQSVDAGPTEGDAVVAPPVVGTSDLEANPADVVEQELTVTYDEDDQ